MPGRNLSSQTKRKNCWGHIDLDAPWEYQPWIHTRELYQGNGRRHLIADIKYPERTVCLMSDLELDVYRMLRNDERVNELFEQYPLELHKTLSICEQNGLRHPRIPSGGEFAVMTTDFLAIIQNGKEMQYRAYAVKMSKDLEKQRILEKLKIEQKFWEECNVPWCIITELDL